MKGVTSTSRREDSEAGFSVVELAVGGFLASLLLASLAAFLMSSFNTGLFTEGQAYTINDVRNVMQQIEKETRGAQDFVWCHAAEGLPPGSCIEVGSTTPTGNHSLVRYLHVGTALQRKSFNYGSDEWGPAHTLLERLANVPGQPVFDCDTQTTTLLRVIVDLYVEPTPQSDPVFHVQASFRPRNFPSVATCP